MKRALFLSSAGLLLLTGCGGEDAARTPSPVSPSPTVSAAPTASQAPWWESLAPEDLPTQVASLEELAGLERECGAWQGVEEVVYQQKIVEAVMRNLNRLNVILLGLGGFLLLVTVMLISNTLRLAVASRRQAIATMKLVGATPGFIRRPFVLRSFTQGVVAGVLASGLLYLFADGLSEVMPDVKLVADGDTFALLFSAMVLAGVLICTTFTALAVNRYVRQTD